MHEFVRLSISRAFQPANSRWNRPRNGLKQMKLKCHQQHFTVNLAKIFILIMQISKKQLIDKPIQLMEGTFKELKTFQDPLANLIVHQDLSKAIIPGLACFKPYLSPTPFPGLCFLYYIPYCTSNRWKCTEMHNKMAMGKAQFLIEFVRAVYANSRQCPCPVTGTNCKT